MKKKESPEHISPVNATFFWLLVMVCFWTSVGAVLWKVV